MFQFAACSDNQSSDFLSSGSNYVQVPPQGCDRGKNLFSSSQNKDKEHGA